MWLCGCSLGPAKEDTQFNPLLAEAAYWFLTLGTAGRVLGELLRPGNGSLLLRWVVVAGGTAQAAGLAIFFWTMWTRIRGRAMTGVSHENP